MFNDLRDKKILVTGSTKGIGFAAAWEFAKQGAIVGINSHIMDAAAEKAIAEFGFFVTSRGFGLIEQAAHW
ncbi:MAG: hypothetical protein ACTH3D_11405, partial [Halomonas sp.]